MSILFLLSFALLRISANMTISIWFLLEASTIVTARVSGYIICQILTRIFHSRYRLLRFGMEEAGASFDNS